MTEASALGIEGGVRLGKVDTTATYDPPAKYKGKKNAFGKKVGQRIDPSTPLGKELADLRLAWECAAQARIKLDRGDLDLQRRFLERSSNVPIDPLGEGARRWRAQRDSVIRKRMNEIIQACIDAHGRPPATIGVPAETIEEIREACWDYDVEFVLETTEA